VDGLGRDDSGGEASDGPPTLRTKVVVPWRGQTPVAYCSRDERGTGRGVVGRPPAFGPAP
jgi:hypothetical protein